ncbi:MAG: hypothetical protein ACE5EE_09900, partial [Fidelibacterota bacterium]
MKRFVLLTLTVLVYLVPINSPAQESAFWCGTPELSPLELQEARADLQRRLAGKRFIIEEPIVIPVAFHIILNSNGEGDISTDQIDAQVEHMTGA